MLYLCNHPSGGLPTLGLVQKPLVLHQGFETGPSHRTFQQLLDVPLQGFVGRYPDGILHTPLLQCFVNLRFGKGRVSPKRNFLPPSLLAFDLRQQEFFPTVSTGCIAGPQLRSKTVASAVEQQQRVIAGGFKVPIVGALLLLPLYRNL